MEPAKFFLSKVFAGSLDSEALTHGSCHGGLLVSMADGFTGGLAPRNKACLPVCFGLLSNAGRWEFVLFEVSPYGEICPFPFVLAGA